jgi:hypothetical protein
VPVHYGTYWPIGMDAVRPHEFHSPADDFARIAARVAPGVAVRCPAHGETIHVEPANGAPLADTGTSRTRANPSAPEAPDAAPDPGPTTPGAPGTPTGPDAPGASGAQANPTAPGPAHGPHNPGNGDGTSTGGPR